ISARAPSVTRREAGSGRRIDADPEQLRWSGLPRRAQSPAVEVRARLPGMAGPRGGREHVRSRAHRRRGPDDAVPAHGEARVRSLARTTGELIRRGPPAKCLRSPPGRAEAVCVRTVAASPHPAPSVTLPSVTSPSVIPPAVIAVHPAHAEWTRGRRVWCA